MKTIKLTVLATVATLALIGCGGGGDSTPSASVVHPYDAPAISEADKNAYLNAVNGARSVGRTCGEHGFFPASAPLAWSDALYKASYEHNVDMTESNFFSHNGSGSDTDWTAQILELGRGSSFVERMTNNGVPINVSASENIGKGFSSLSAIMNALLSSPGHCVNIMDAGGQYMGMSRIGNTWGQNFWSDK